MGKQAAANIRNFEPLVGNNSNVWLTVALKCSQIHSRSDIAASTGPVISEPRHSYTLMYHWCTTRLETGESRKLSILIVCTIFIRVSTAMSFLWNGHRILHFHKFTTIWLQTWTLGETRKYRYVCNLIVCLCWFNFLKLFCLFRSPLVF